MPCPRNDYTTGPLAQLAERGANYAEVVSSILLRAITTKIWRCLTRYGGVICKKSMMAFLILAEVECYKTISIEKAYSIVYSRKILNYS